MDQCQCFLIEWNQQALSSKWIFATSCFFSRFRIFISDIFHVVVFYEGSWFATLHLLPMLLLNLFGLILSDEDTETGGATSVQFCPLHVLSILWKN
jgi:hypothetical protein